MQSRTLAALMQAAVTQLSEEDPFLYNLLEQEYQRQTDTLTLVAASSMASPAILACEGSIASNVTTEGYPGARFHAGCKVIDDIENLAIDRAKTAFRACYANVQPHSGSSANMSVLLSLLEPGDTILGMELNSGGHLTHGAKASLSGQYFHVVNYGVDEHGYIDYEQVYSLAMKHRPRMIFCGASAYPRCIDFARFRSIADEVNAILLADISHIAGLVVAGEHPSPIDHAHITTTSTYKQLYGPRGGLILMGKDYEQLAPDGRQTLSSFVQRAVFPFFQGTPHLSAIAAKARALSWVTTPEFALLARRIICCAQALAKTFTQLNYQVLTGGTDNHLMLLDVSACNLTGVAVERALEACNIIVNKNRIPGDMRPATIASGIRLGTNNVAFRGMEDREMVQCVHLIDQVITFLIKQRGTDAHLDVPLQQQVLAEVKALCDRFPIPAYPVSVSAVGVGGAKHG